jgi:hypothetical protein
MSALRPIGTPTDEAAHQYARQWALLNDRSTPMPADMPMTRKEIMDMLFGAGVAERASEDDHA